MSRRRIDWESSDGRASHINGSSLEVTYHILSGYVCRNVCSPSFSLSILRTGEGRHYIMAYGNDYYRSRELHNECLVT